jgi:hypothetical protein
MRKLLSLVLLCCVSVPAFCQVSNSSPNIGLGVVVGDFLPSSTTISHAFGSNILTYGLSPVAFGRPNTSGLTPNISVIAADQNGSNFLIVPLTMGYEYHFGDSSSSTVPYARIDGGLAYFSFSVNTPGGTVTGNDLGEVADAELGVEFAKSLRLSAKYSIFSEEHGLSFNGLQIGLTLNLIRF